MGVQATLRLLYKFCLLCFNSSFFNLRGVNENINLFDVRSLCVFKLWLY